MQIANCLNYGHSCWGGHGKRSAISTTENRQQKLLPSGRFGFLQVILDNVSKLRQGFTRKKSNKSNFFY